VCGNEGPFGNFTLTPGSVCIEDVSGCRRQDPVCGRTLIPGSVCMLDVSGCFVGGDAEEGLCTGGVESREETPGA